MKKLLIAIASAASIAGMAKAAAFNTETGTSFTGNTVGVFNPGTPDTDFISGEEPVGSPYWSVPDGADTTSLQIKQGELPTVTRPKQWQGKDTDGTYLSIDISEKLTRNLLISIVHHYRKSRAFLHSIHGFSFCILTKIYIDL